jgi:hypothetical protein
MGFLTEMWVVFGAKTDKLKQGTREAEQTLDQFKERANRIGTAIGTAFSVGAISMFIGEVSRLARGVDEVERAFGSLNAGPLLNRLREATSGTVRDLDLMKGAVRANSLGIPLKQLATYYEYAERQAGALGISTENAIEAIVQGIGNKAPRAFRQLGISTIEVQKAFGDLNAETLTVEEISARAFLMINEKLNEMGPNIDSATDALDRNAAAWENVKIKFGGFINKVKAEWSPILLRIFGGQGFTPSPGEAQRNAAMDAVLEKWNASQSKEERDQAAREASTLIFEQQYLRMLQEQEDKKKESLRLAKEELKVRQTERERFADLVARGVIKTPGLSRTEVNKRIGQNSLTNPEESKIIPLTPDTADLDAFNGTMDEIDARWEQSASHANDMAQMIVGAFSNVTDIKSFANAVKDAARNVILATISETVALNVAKAVRQGKTWYGAVIQGALAAAATTAVFNAIPSFATGGMANGPTLAMVGDNPSGKEMMVPMPWNGMQGLIANQSGGRVEFILRGQDLYGSYTKYQKHLNNV